MGKHTTTTSHKHTYKQPCTHGATICQNVNLQNAQSKKCTNVKKFSYRILNPLVTLVKEMQNEQVPPLKHLTTKVNCYWDIPVEGESGIV